MKRFVIALLAAVAIGVVIWLAVQRLEAVPSPGTLYGNVEIRQVNLSFNAEGTVISLPKREGDRGRRGETTQRRSSMCCWPARGPRKSMRRAPISPRRRPRSVMRK